MLDPLSAMSATSIDGEKSVLNILAAGSVEVDVLRGTLDDSGLCLSSELLMPEGSLEVAGDTEEQELDEVAGVRNGSSTEVL